MTNKNFNKTSTESTNDIKNFAVLTSGAIVKYFEMQEDSTKSYRVFTHGRVITPAVPNGVAFTELRVERIAMIGIGKLLHPENDVRSLEEAGTEADKF